MAYHKIVIIYFMDKRALGNLKFVRANKSFSLIPRSNNLSVMLILTSTKRMTFLNLFSWQSYFCEHKFA